MLYSERDGDRTIALRAVKDGWEPDDKRTVKRFDIGATAIYAGEAASGTATAAAAWTIKKISLDGSGNPTSITMTAIRSAVWDNRTTESYT